ncbi:aspartate kinase [Allomyces macrogynus ATCC 38327]|uniref:Aspartokinase n=1 Tax=Allomyces macrogynus (strain ATCC 38327) TaxID=578462 RepID=A0A0L0RW89_ALLM3|nr:aspartate kinase [Allomyces macrogynus ATCC 38327]|eukprot:KNE54578.1 aspartate kinase [Allomyces macrogynus ATCC 38327]
MTNMLHNNAAASNGATINGTRPAANGMMATNGAQSASSALPWVAMKFGGTSVGTAERLLAVSDIVRSQLEHCRPVLVCSAMSSVKKASGTTSLLLRAAEQALHAGGESTFLSIVDQISANHLQAAREALPNSPDLLATIQSEIQSECQKLGQFLRAIRIIDEISPKSRDIIVSTGEKLSCMVMTAVLQSRGIDAVFVNADRVIEQEFNESELNQDFYDYVARRLGEVVRDAAGRDAVPVVTGFIGPVPGSLIQAVGRGYTDLTAALVAVGLHAQEVQIWKEVDGIFTADPRKVPSARLLPSITPDEAAELTYYGSEVIHPFTMDQVIRAGVPIRIKNTFNPSGAGTIIAPVDDANECSESLISRRSFEDLKLPTAVTIKDSIIVLNIRSNRKSNSHGFLSKIFTILDRHGVIVDLITTSEIHVSMALAIDESEDLNELGVPKSLNYVVTEFGKLGTVSVLPRQVILSAVGRHMKHMVGTASKMFNVMATAGVNIEMISQGASEINISCVIAQESAIVALRAVHDRFITLLDGAAPADPAVVAVKGAASPARNGVAAGKV